MRKRILLLLLLLLSIYFYYPPSSSISISSFNLIYATFRPFLSLFFFSFTTFPPQGLVTRLPPAPSALTDATLSPSNHKTLSPIFSAGAML